MSVIHTFLRLHGFIFWGLIFIWSKPGLASNSDELRFRLSGITLSTSFESIGDHLEYKELNKVIRSERFKLGDKVSFSELKIFSQAVTRYMQDQGYSFHYAYFPEQDIDDGILNVSIRAVRLGEVRIENHSGIDDQLFKDQFAELIDKPVYQPDIDQVILRISAHEEILAYAYYRQGTHRVL